MMEDGNLARRPDPAEPGSETTPACPPPRVQVSEAELDRAAAEFMAAMKAAPVPDRIKSLAEDLARALQAHREGRG